jgi:glycosyltransferase involved in cell wall biosynthesis
MSKIKVLAIPSDKHGVGKYRILDPYTYIGENFSDEIRVDIVFDVEDNDTFFKKYDIVIFHSFIIKKSHDDNVKRLKWLKDNGIKTVMDIDDYWQVDTRHPMYQQIKQNRVAEKKVELLKMVNYITTTTSILSNTLSTKLNINGKRIEVFPNAINPNEKQFISKPIPSDRIRFGWLGGSSHYFDLELLNNGINSILSKYNNETQFVLCGFDLRGNVREFDKTTNTYKSRPIKPMETIWYGYEKIFTNNYRHISEDYRNFLLSFERKEYDSSNESYVRKWTEDITKYGFNYNQMDVSLIPLIDSLFNANKSQLKIIEAGFHKKAVIVSDVDPYRTDSIHSLKEGVFTNEGNSLMVSPKRNHKDWEKSMKKLIENPNMIIDLGERLYETVKDKYSLINVSENRVQFIKYISNK